MNEPTAGDEMQVKPNLPEQINLQELAHKLHYAAYSWGFEAGKVGQHVDTTNAGNKADAALKALLAALSAAPAQEPRWVELTDEDRQAVHDQLPDALDGFLKLWGWLHFAKAIEAKVREKNAHLSASPLQQEGKAGEWLPIESAPKDGSSFLIWTKRLGFAVVSHDVDDPMPTGIVPSGHCLVIDDGKFAHPIRGDYPTHWQPLPIPPEEAS